MATDEFEPLRAPATVGWNMGFAVQTLFDAQYRLCYSIRKGSHGVLLTPLQFHKSARMEPILQTTGATPRGLAL
jgi:hypothetical protein